MRTLTLTDGTTYEVDWCNADYGVFNINLKTDKNFLELANKFGDNQLTKRIVIKLGEENEKTYSGYTVLRSIQFDMWRSGTVLITLMLPEKVSVA